MNKSEQLLEAWCSQNGWLCERIPEESVRTPDYRIKISGIKLFAEVKEIVANEEEIKVIRQLSERGWSGARWGQACNLQFTNSPTLEKLDALNCILHA